MDGLGRIFRALRRRVQLLINRAIVNAVNSDGNIQLVQVSTGKKETLHDIEHHEPYGFTSRALVGAEALVASLGGSRSHSLIFLVGDRRHRLTALAEGEVALYDDQGQQIILKRDGIEINAPLGYTVNGDGVFNGASQFVGAVQMDSTLNVDGNATSLDFISNGKSGANHNHDETGSVTGAPN